MSLTYTEILKQPAAWAAALNRCRRLVRNRAASTSRSVTQPLHGFRDLAFTSRSRRPRGSWSSRGRQRQQSRPPEAFLSPATTVPTTGSVIAFIISRSGTTSEASLAADHLRHASARVARSASPATAAPSWRAMRSLHRAAVRGRALGGDDPVVHHDARSPCKLVAATVAGDKPGSWRNWPCCRTSFATSCDARAAGAALADSTVVRQDDLPRTGTEPGSCRGGHAQAQGDDPGRVRGLQPTRVPARPDLDRR